MQALMDTARHLEMDEQAEDVGQKSETDEITDVDTLVSETPSLTGSSEPAMESAISDHPPESVPDASPTEHLVDEPLADSSPDQQGATLGVFSPESTPAEPTTLPETDDVEQADTGLSVSPLPGASPPAELVDHHDSGNQVDQQLIEPTPVPVPDLVQDPAAEIPLVFTGPEAETETYEPANRRTETSTHFPEGREAEFNEMISMAEQKIMSQESGGLNTSIVDPEYNADELPTMPELTYGKSTESDNMERLFSISSDIQKWSRS